MREGEPHFNDEASVETQEKSEKEIAWEKQMQEVEKIPNLEYGVKKIITALNISGIPTSQSCEGHIDHEEDKTRITTPFIEISAPRQTRKRFIGQKTIIPRIAKKYGIPPEDVRTMILHSAPWEEFKNAKDTQGYKKWRRENKKIAEKAEIFLKYFYQDSITPEDIRLTISEQNAGQFEITNSGGNEIPQAEAEQRLAQYQNEMNNFAQFLKEKYFKE